MRVRTHLSSTPPQPDPTTSTLPEDTYRRPYEYWLPLAQPSGVRGIVSRSIDQRRRPSPPGGGGGGPADAAALAAQQGLLSDREPWLFPPRDAFPLELFATSVSVAATTTLTIITMAQLPRGTSAVFKRFANQSTDFTNTVWNFLIRNRPVSPVANMSGFQFGQMFDPRPLPGPGVMLESGDDFVVQVTNNSGVAVTVSARIEGYQWAWRGGKA